MGNSSALASAQQPVVDRRTHDRPRMVFRVGLLEFGGKTTFCLLRNISPNGAQVKLYSAIPEGSDVSLCVGDEKAVDGRVAWTRNGLAGITFKCPLDATTLLRVKQMEAPQRRRASPRASASGSAILRTGGREYSAKLVDISTTGAKIFTARPIEPGNTAALVLPRLPSLRAFVRWTQGRDTGLTFESPMPIQVIAEWLMEHPLMPANSLDDDGEVAITGPVVSV
jgi:hypothetical protein